jgi:hypothetical protein
VARAAPDGYTLLLGGSNNNAITPALYKGLDFDPMKDFAPIAALATESLVLVIHPSVPARTLSELVRYGKENPGKLTSGATVGIAPHLLLEFIRIRSGTNIMFVPYKGAAPAITDVLGGQIQVHVSAKSVLLPLINSGKLRALVVTSADRWPELPERLRRLPDRAVVRVAGACGHVGRRDREAERSGCRAVDRDRHQGGLCQNRARTAHAQSARVRPSARRRGSPLGGSRTGDRREAGVTLPYRTDL